MEKKQKLIDLLKFCHAEIHRLADQLDSEERNRVGLVDHWSPHDVLAHLAEEHKRLADRLEQINTNRNEQELLAFDGVNAATWEAYRGRSLDVILKVLDAAHEKLLIQLGSLEATQFDLHEDIAWLDGRPLWRYIAGVGFLHALAHLRTLYIDRHDFENAKFLCQEEASLGESLHDSPDWRAVITYNAGCNYALMGEKSLALEALSSSLRSSPRLIEWSEQDTDLDTLRAEPEFIALMAELKKSG